MPVFNDKLPAHKRLHIQNCISTERLFYIHFNRTRSHLQFVNKDFVSSGLLRCTWIETQEYKEILANSRMNANNEYLIESPFTLTYAIRNDE